MVKSTGAEQAAEDRLDGEPGETQGVRSVQRAIDILGLLTESQPAISVSEIVRATGLAKTTVIRLVQTLEQNGLLWATAKGYMAGPSLWRWAHLARGSWELPPETQRLMRELAASERETVNVYVARDIVRVCIAQPGPDTFIAVHAVSYLGLLFSALIPTIEDFFSDVVLRLDNQD